MNPPKKTNGETVNLSSVATPNNAPPPHIVDPIHGPTNIGINTDATILKPWNNPTLSIGVYFLITALKQAVADKYPLIINKQPINMPISSVKIVRNIRPNDFLDTLSSMTR